MYFFVLFCVPVITIWETESNLPAGREFLELHKWHALFAFIIKKCSTSVVTTYNPKFTTFFFTPHPIYPVSPQSVLVKQIATIQSALKPNTASTDPMSSVSPVGSAGMELPWLASASLPLETQPPWAYCYIIYLNCKRRTSNNE